MQEIPNGYIYSYGEVLNLKVWVQVTKAYAHVVLACELHKQVSYILAIIDGARAHFGMLLRAHTIK